MKKNEIIICQGSSCFSRGNKENLRAIQSFLSSSHLMSTVSFKGQLCTSNCKVGPVIIINGETFTELKPEDIEGILTKKLLE